MTKAISFNTTDAETLRIGHYQKILGITQAAFVRQAIQEKCDILKAERAGNKFIEIKSPALSGFNKEQELEIITILQLAENQIASSCGESARQFTKGLIEALRDSFSLSEGKRALLKAQALLDQEAEESADRILKELADEKNEN